MNKNVPFIDITVDAETLLIAMELSNGKSRLIIEMERDGIAELIVGLQGAVDYIDTKQLPRDVPLKARSQ